MDKQATIFSFFSGAGFLDLGFEMAGFWRHINTVEVVLTYLVLNMDTTKEAQLSLLQESKSLFLVN
jgi:hypothetical protein